MVFILGVGFQYQKSRTEIPPSLDVILVQTSTEKTPEEADYLAQANQEGGGENEHKARPQALFSAPNLNTAFGIAPIRLQAASPKANEQQLQKVLTQDQSTTAIYLPDDTTKNSPDKKRRSDEQVERSLEMARLAAEINRDVNNYAKRPRKKFIHARTKESASAAYMYDWVSKVERLGNLNYPDQARRSKLSGSLVLVVGIKADGSLQEIILRNSSGKQVLDDAAQRIVTLAAPYEPFPETLRKDTDILYITRTWQFHSDHLSSR